MKVLGYRNSHFIGGTKLIKQGPGASHGYIVTMTEELSEKGTKTEDNRAKRGRWGEIKRVVERDKFLMVPLDHLLEIYLQTSIFPFFSLESVN